MSKISRVFAGLEALSDSFSISGRSGAVISLAALMAIWAGFSGFDTVEATGTCFTQEVTCHGLPVGDRCIGFSRESYDYVSKQSCESLDEIRERCGTVRNFTCRSGDEWIQDSAAFGRSCAVWNRTYDLGMESCKQ